MARAHGHMAYLLLRCASPLSRLRRVPVLGGLLSWTSRQLVPPDSLIWIRIQKGPAQGLWIRVNPRTGQNVQQGIGEPAVQAAIQKHLSPGMTFYDLGANIGFFSLMAARLVGPGGCVISFEADPEIAARLRENLAYNKFTHASAEEKAVWSEPTTVSFTRVDSSSSPDRGLGHISTGDSADAERFPSKLSRSMNLFYCILLQTSSNVTWKVRKLPFFKAPSGCFAKSARFSWSMHSSENHRVLTQKFRQLGYDCSNLDENHVLALPQ